MIQETETKPKLITSKILFYLVIVLGINLLYFAADLIPDRTPTYLKLRQIVWDAEDKEQESLKVLVESSNGNLLYNNYQKDKANTVQSEKNFENYKNSIKFFSFNDFWQFLYEFGKSFPYLLLLIGLLFWFLTRKKVNKGIVFIISSFIAITFFKMFWIFQPFKDVSKFTYYIVSIGSTILFSISFYHLSKYRKSKIKKLQKLNRELLDERQELIIKTIIHEKNPEKKQQLLDALETVY